MEPLVKLLEKTAVILGVDKVKMATEGDKGPFFILRTRWFDDGYSYTALSSEFISRSILVYETLEEAKGNVGKELCEVSHHEGKEVCKPRYLIVTY